jgi:hypothetical protein
VIERGKNMGKRKKYGDSDVYEKKLEKVMERFGVTHYSFDWSRSGGCWIDFVLDGEEFHFPYSVEMARANGIELHYGSDAFASLVLTLEDLARANERGTFKLKKVLRAMALLPAPVEIPSFFKFLGFDTIPPNAIEVEIKFKALAKQMHPDVGGNTEDFKNLQLAREQAMKYFDR